MRKLGQNERTGDKSTDLLELGGNFFSGFDFALIEREQLVLNSDNLFLGLFKFVFRLSSDLFRSGYIAFQALNFFLKLNKGILGQRVDRTIDTFFFKCSCSSMILLAWSTVNFNTSGPLSETSFYSHVKEEVSSDCY